MKIVTRHWTMWVVVALVVGFVGVSVAQAPKPLVVTSWGGAYQEAQRKAFLDAFTKATGIKIVEASPTDYGKLEAMIKAGNVEWDVVDVDLDYVIRGGNKGLLEKLDYAKMGLKKEDYLPRTQFDHGTGNIFYSTIMAWNTKKIPPGSRPAGWQDFWDVKKFPGPRALWKYPLATLEAALIADGVSIDKLYPLDVDRAFRSLDKIKPHVTVWWETGAKPAQLLTDGEVVMSSAWNGRIQTVMKQGASVAFTWNGGALAGDAWSIPKGAKNIDAALKFISWVQAAKQQAELTKYIEYGPTHMGAFQFIDPKVDLPTTPVNRAVQVFVDVNWWVENFDKVNERFLAWVAK